MKSKNKNKKAKETSNISMSLYDINQSIISQLLAYDDNKINDLQNRINNWYNINNKYYMLLCNDIHYYTVLCFSNNENKDFSNLGQAATNLLLERNYTIQSDEQCEDHFEIWAKDESGTYAFILFPYDEGVVTYG